MKEDEWYTVEWKWQVAEWLVYCDSHLNSEGVGIDLYNQGEKAESQLHWYASWAWEKMTLEGSIKDTCARGEEEKTEEKALV